MDNATLQRCQQLIGYHFENTDLLVQALTHASVAPTRIESNERQEFLGDAVLALVVCHELYDKHPDLLEGEMTGVKSAVVSRQTCAEVVETTDIGDLLVMDKGVPTPGGLPQSVSAAVFEAIIGAIYLDGGLQPARQFILKHIGPHIEEALASAHQRNYKSLLQQHAQRQWQTTPEYNYLDEKGPDHDKCFEVAVSLNGRPFSSAWGKSKKEAEQEAARKALSELGLLAEDE